MDRQLRVGLLLGAAGMIAGVALLVPSAPKPSQRVQYVEVPAQNTAPAQPAQTTNVYVLPNSAVGGGPPVPTDTATQSMQATAQPQQSVPSAAPAPTVTVVYTSAPTAAPTEVATSAPTATATTTATPPAPTSSVLGIQPSGGVYVTDSGVMIDPNLPFIVPAPVIPAGGNGVVSSPTGGGAGAVPPSTGGAGNVPPSQGGAGGVAPSQGGAGGVSPSQGGAGGISPSQGGAGAVPISPGGAGGSNPH